METIGFYCAESRCGVENSIGMTAAACSEFYCNNAAGTARHDSLAKGLLCGRGIDCVRPGRNHGELYIGVWPMTRKVRRRGSRFSASDGTSRSDIFDRRTDGD